MIFAMTLAALLVILNHSDLTNLVIFLPEESTCKQLNLTATVCMADHVHVGATACVA